MAAIGYLSLRTSQKTLENAIGESSATLAAQTLRNINENIYHRIENIQSHATNKLVLDFTSESNEEFERLPDPNGHIEWIEKNWTSPDNAQNPVMTKLTNNELTRRLETLRSFYMSKNNYPLFAEIFITNRFGVNIAQTNMTSDYYQADEKWWQLARKNGLFVSDIEYDESSNTSSIEIAVRITNTDGDFIGVIKAVLNIQETINTVKEVKIASKYKTLQLNLVNEAGNIIYSTLDAPPENVKSMLISHFGVPGKQQHKDYFIGHKDREKGILFAHAHSQRYRDFKGLGWILFTETETAEIFAPITSLKSTMLLVGIVIIGLALVAATLIYRSIVIPITALQKATDQISTGNLDTNLITTSTDEIGQLAGSFQKMTHQLKKTITELNNEIAERTKAENELNESKLFLDDIFDSIQDGISVLDTDLNILKVNLWMEKMYADQMPLIGKKCYKVYQNSDSVCPWCPSVETLKTGLTKTCIVPYVSEKQQKGWVELSSFPLKNPDGGMVGIIEHVKDITERKKAEQSLKMSERRFRQVVENAREWIWEVDAEGLYTYTSPIIKEILGFSSEDIVGKKHLYDLFHPKDREKLKNEVFDIFLKKQNLQKFVSRNLHKDGHTVWLSTSAVPILNEQEELLGYRGVDADITDQRKAETILAERAEQVMHYHNILLQLANMPEQDLDSLLNTTTEQDAEVLDVERVSVWFFNKERTEITCRDMFSKTEKAHKTSDNIKLKDYPFYFKALDGSRVIAANNAQTDPRTSEFNDTYLKDNKVTSMMDVPIRLHGQIVGIICHEHSGTAREWTNAEQDFAASAADMISLKLEAAERRKAELALEKLNKDLEETVEELSRSNRQLKDFVHISAHDLKTPVRGIGTLADWIVSDYGDKLDEHGREQIRLLKTRVVRIDKLIEGMLVFSKIVRSKHNERQVNLNELVSETIKNIKPPDNIEIAVDSLPNINCESEHLSQVFRHLISNAVIFMDKPKGLIKVGCVEQGDMWRFYVSDNGSGIEQKYFERIFRIFQTLPKNDEPETAGTGLAIVNKIVELYNGKIWLESQFGIGSTFFFTFPKQREESVYEDAKSNTAC